MATGYDWNSAFLTGLLSPSLPAAPAHRTGAVTLTARRVRILADWKSSPPTAARQPGAL
ncbi:MAG: hypothetical protein J0H14_14325 [Alphaproteobacteria bacterium]|nr:hypothetical protein [Alphaproteobacteria bacterium]